MLEFWIALLVFIGSHSIIARSGLRGLIINKWSKKAYLSFYSFLSLILLAWLIIAAQNAPRVQLWPWIADLYWIPNIFMPFACILLISGFIVPNPLSIMAKNKGFDPQKPGFIVALTRHPVLWGFFLWSASHVVPNGEYPLIVMFVIFAGFSLVGLKIVDKKSKKRWGMRNGKYWRKIRILSFSLHPLCGPAALNLLNMILRELFPVYLCTYYFIVFTSLYLELIQRRLFNVRMCTIL